MADTPQYGEFCWNELITPDVEKAKTFYNNLFGWTHQDHPMKDINYTMFMMGEKMIGGLFETPSQEKGKIPPHWTSYILVKDLAEKVNKAQSLGAQVVVPPKVIEGFGQLAVIVDPTGAHIALWESFTS